MESTKEPFTVYDLKFFRFSAYFRVLDELSLPGTFAGNVVRSALGRAMHSVRFGTSGICKECPIRAECRYTDIFSYLFESPFDHPLIGENENYLPDKYKQKNYPGPFVFVPPSPGLYLQGQELRIDFTLIGMAIQFFPFMVCSLERFASNGLARYRSRLALEKIVCQDNSDSAVVHASNAPVSLPDSTSVLSTRKILGQCSDFDISASDSLRMKIRFLTPFRVKHQNRLPRDLTFEILARSVFRRLVYLTLYKELGDMPLFEIDYAALLPRTKEISEIENRIEWVESGRYSVRRRQRMKIGGYLGTIEFGGDLVPFIPHVSICKYAHIGTKTSFGFGTYEASVSAP